MPANIPDIPLSVFASWPTPNYVDPIRRSWMPAYSGALQAISTLLVCTRLWLRARNKAGPFGLDDCLLIPAYLAATLYTAIIIGISLSLGADRHMWDVPPANYVKLTLAAWILELAYLVSTCCTKVSVLLFYRRLVRGTYNRIWRWMTLGAVALTIVYGLGFVLTLILACHPVQSYWLAFSPTYTGEYTCVDTRSTNILSGVVSVVSDFYAVFLPMGILRGFNISRRKKLALYSIFSLGLLVVAAGSVRVYYMSKMSYDYDITWNGFNIFIWSVLEIQLAIICASAPVLRVVFRQYFKEPLSRVRTTQSGKSDNEKAGRLKKQPLVEFDSHEHQNHHSSSKFNTTTLLESIDEADILTAPPAVVTSPDTRTPDEFEVYALNNLDHSRMSWRRHGHMQNNNCTEYDRLPSEFNRTSPVSWLNVGKRS